MQLPKFHETFMPILEILGNGEIIHNNELKHRVKNKYYNHLSDELLEQTTSTGNNRLFDRISWGKSYLHMGKFIHYPQRGLVQITDKGKARLQQGELSLQQLSQDTDFLAYTSPNKPTNQPILHHNDQSPQEQIENNITAIEQQVQSDLLERLKTIDPYEFERIILKLFHLMGYGDMIYTNKSKDGGIDGIINQDKLGLEKIYIQTKRYSDNNVRETDIRNFIGAMSGDTMKGVFVTTSDFDSKAQEKAKTASNKIILINGIQLAQLMYEYGLGVQSTITYTIKRLDEDFFDNL